MCWSTTRGHHRRAQTPTAARAQWTRWVLGSVFKTQANMDTAHRDQMAFVRGCAPAGSNEAWRSPTPGTRRPFAIRYAQQVFGRDRDSPGAIVAIGDSFLL